MPVPDRWVQGEYLVVRHIPTGKMIPQPYHRQKGGSSYLEPEEPWKHPPRLFRNQASARSFLSIWLKGRVITNNDRENTGYQPVPSRIKEEMEIIPLKLVLEPRSTS